MNLLNVVEDKELKNHLNDLYRPGATRGSGSTADLIRLAPDAGHIIKAQKYLHPAISIRRYR